jgi:hypothetical protein
MSATQRTSAGDCGDRNGHPRRDAVHDLCDLGKSLQGHLLDEYVNDAATGKANRESVIIAHPVLLEAGRSRG